MTEEVNPAATPLSIVIPAHNEESVIAELLGPLTTGAAPGELEVVVACNACTDNTTAIACSFGDVVSVVELPEPSKRRAQRAADERLTTFPRLYVDADVILDLAGARALARGLARDGVLAAAPRRRLEVSRSSWVVRRYYRVWERLPHVEQGLFGRGVVAVSEAGAARILALPDVLSDDLAMSEAFAPNERTIVDAAEVIIRLPRTSADLLRRRVRVATGTAQADAMGWRGQPSTTSGSTLMALARHDWRFVPDVAVFIGVTIVARLQARRRVRANDFTTWERDESSRLRE